MTVSADSHDQKGAPDDDLAVKSSPLTNAGRLSDGHSDSGKSMPMQQTSGSEEPDMALEPDLPSDGRDVVGEAMIRDLPQRPELSEPPSQPDLFTQEN